MAFKALTLSKLPVPLTIDQVALLAPPPMLPDKLATSPAQIAKSVPAFTVGCGSTVKVAIVESGHALPAPTIAYTIPLALS